jgi:hypothetical protein
VFRIGSKIAQSDALKPSRVSLFTAFGGLEKVIFHDQQIPLEVTIGLILKWTHEFKVEPKPAKERLPVMPQLDYDTSWGFFNCTNQGHCSLYGIRAILFLNHSHYFFICYTTSSSTIMKAKLLVFRSLLYLAKIKKVHQI